MKDAYDTHEDSWPMVGGSLMMMIIPKSEKPFTVA